MMTSRRGNPRGARGVSTSRGMVLLVLLVLGPVLSLCTVVPDCSRNLPPNKGYLVSDNYPFDYRSGASCNYLLKVPSSMAVCFRFYAFSTQRVLDYLQFLGKPNGSSLVGPFRYTGSGHTAGSTQGPFIWSKKFCWLPSHDNFLWLDFQSSTYVQSTGFRASYHIVNHVDEIPEDPHAPGPVLITAQFKDTFDNIPSRWPQSLTGSPWKTRTQNRVPGFGPDTDHTTGHGRYLAADFYHDFKDPNTHTALFSAATPAIGEHCLSFWYHMNGYGGGQLNVYHHTLDSAPIITRDGSFGDYWHHAHMSVYNNNSSNSDIIFEAKRGTSYRVPIAIDDVSYMPGPCPYYDDVSCTFNTGSWCGWTSNGKFTIATDPASGHDTVHQECRDANDCLTVALLTSPPISISGTSCLILTYRSEKDDKPKILSPRGDAPDQMTTHATFGGWTVAMANVKGNDRESYKINITSYLERGGYFDIVNITFIQVPCIQIAPTGSYSCPPGQFTCANKDCISDHFRCNGDENCRDSSDEKDCNCDGPNCPTPPSDPTDPSQPAFSYSPVALIALVAGCVLVLLIIIIKIGLCLHARYRRRHLESLRERRLEALRSRGGTTDVNPEEYLPPRYSDCIRDNPGFVLGEEDGEDKLPSYSEVIGERYMQITSPLASELSRLRQLMRGRAKEENQEGASEGRAVGVSEGGQGGEGTAVGVRNNEDVRAMEEGQQVAYVASEGVVNAGASLDDTSPPVEVQRLSQRCNVVEQIHTDRDGPRPPTMNRPASGPELTYSGGISGNCQRRPEPPTSRIQSTLYHDDAGLEENTYDRPTCLKHRDNNLSNCVGETCQDEQNRSNSEEFVEQPAGGNLVEHSSASCGREVLPPVVPNRDCAVTDVTLAVWDDSEIEV